MKRSRTWPLLLCFAALCWPKMAAAQTNFIPQTEIERSCSEQADRQGLHGEARANFRAQCKASAQGNAPAQVPGLPAETAQGNSGATNLYFQNGVLVQTSH
jgi:hypothetical protein